MTIRLGGITVIEHPLAVMRVPIRKHNKRKGSAAYHRRTQKKWTKRFGTKTEPCAFMISPNALGMIGPDRLLINPLQMAALRNFIS